MHPRQEIDGIHCVTSHLPQIKLIADKVPGLKSCSLYNVYIYIPSNFHPISREPISLDCVSLRDPISRFFSLRLSFLTGSLFFNSIIYSSSRLKIGRDRSFVPTR